MERICAAQPPAFPSRVDDIEREQVQIGRPFPPARHFDADGTFAPVPDTTQLTNETDGLKTHSGWSSESLPPCVDYPD